MFTAGTDGGIRAWNIPSFAKDDQYPQTGGRNFCVAVLKDGSNQPYWKLDYHHYLPLLLAVKAGGKVQVWDCKSIVEKTLTYDQENIEQCQTDFIYCDKPLKEYELETGGNPTCAAWMETDNSLFAAGYDNSSLAFFNHNTGKLEF